MSIFSTVRQKRLERIDETKKLTKGKAIETLSDVKKVYIPVVDAKNVALTLNAAIGDEVKVGTCIGVRQDANLPVFSSISGKIIGEENLFHVVLGRPVKHFVIENDGKYKKEKALKELTLDATKEQIVERIREAGIVGLGGAGFPTYRKYTNVQGIDTLLINGIECEPYLTTDITMMQEEAHQMVEGIAYLMKACGASKAVIACKKQYEHVHQAIQLEIKDRPEIELAAVKNAYPLGWERLLIKRVLHREYKMLPSEAHIIVNNAQTAIAVARACKSGEVLTTRVVTVSGDAIQEPKNVLAPIGVLGTDLIAFAGGYKEGIEKAVVCFGGPMCSKGNPSDKSAILPSCNAITVLKEVVYETETCLRCGTCIDHCPAGLMPVEIKDAFQASNIDRMVALQPDSCVGCGLCSYICPSKIDVIEFVKKAKMRVNLVNRNKK